MENNWRFKSLQMLEKMNVENIDLSTHLIKRCTELLKYPLNEYSVEDLRIMISQKIGLKYLIPIAIDKLKENILSEGDFYPGDLAAAVLTVDDMFWKQNNQLLKEVNKLITINADRLIKAGIPLSLIK